MPPPADLVTGRRSARWPQAAGPWLAGALAVVVLSACAGSGSGPGGAGGATVSPSGTVLTPTTTHAVEPPTTPSGTTSPAASTAPVVDKVLVFVVENHSLSQMRAQMPRTYRLAEQFAYADHYDAIRHPSLPNYLAIASGSTQGVTDDAGPGAHRVPGRSVFGLALDAGRTAAVYADGMATPCQTTDSGRYRVRHNPWAYFPTERASCRSHDLPLAALGAAVRDGALPGAGMVVPDLCHDAHDCSLATADAWFDGWMRQVMAGPDWRSGRLAVVLTADEDDQSADNRVLTVVAHPTLHGKVVHTALTHYSLARFYAEVTGTTPLGKAARAPSVATAFGLRTG